MTKKKNKTRPPVSAVKAVAVPKSSPDSFLWPALILAFILRLIYLKTSQASPFYEPLLLDAKYYQEWALRIAHGDLGSDVFYGLPLYPFFLGAVYTFFHDSLFAAKLVQILLGVVTVYYVARITERMADRRAATVAAYLAAIYGPLIFHEALLIPEAIGTPLYAAAFFYTLEFLRQPSLRRARWLGVLFGLCMLTKAGILIFVLVFLANLYFVQSKRHKMMRQFVIQCAGAFLLTMAPVTAHNVVHGKDLVWLTSHSGFNFYVGNNERAEGVFAPPPGTGTNVDSQIEDSKAVAEREMRRTLKPSEVSKYWSDKALNFISNHPGQFLKLCFRKLLLFFDSREISDIEDYQFAALFNPFLKFPWPNFIFLGPLFLLGLVSSFKKIRYYRVMAIWVGGYLAGMMLFFVNARYRLPLLPVMISVAAVAGTQFYTDFVEWRMKRLLIALSVLIAGVVIGQLHLVETNFARDYVNAGDIWLEKNEPVRALPDRKSTRLNSSH